MKLSDIITAGSGGGNIRDNWENTAAAGDFGLLAPGAYVARIIAGEFKQSKRNSTPGYSLTFEVLEPAEHKGRKFWHDCWLTPAAMPQTKRDLGKLGVTNLEQLENPLPKYIRCQCKIALRKDDDGNEANRLKSFEVLGIDKPEADAFAPADDVIERQPGEDDKPEDGGSENVAPTSNPLPF
jgi:hypothetical protein